MATDEWRRANCYNYAVSGRNPAFRYTLPLIPGQVASLGDDMPLNVNADAGELRKNLVADGLIAASGDSMPEGKPGYYAVAAYISDPAANPSFIDYHFVRQDENGVWSHKLNALAEPTDLDAAGHPITDPRTAEFNYAHAADPNLRSSFDYKFVGFFYAPDKGLDCKNPPYRGLFSAPPEMVSEAERYYDDNPRNRYE